MYIHVIYTGILYVHVIYIGILYVHVIYIGILYVHVTQICVRYIKYLSNIDIHSLIRLYIYILLWLRQVRFCTVNND